MKRIFFFLLIVASFISCNHKDETVNFTFLQLNDVYEIAPLEGGKVGGLARVETLHKQLLKENPNTFLFMAGDFLNPSLLGTLKYKGKRIRGRQMVEVMNAMHFDLVAFGNHEFDLNEQDLQSRLNESNFKWIATNVKHKVGDRLEPFYKINKNDSTAIPTTVSFKITNKEGKSIKIGFISATVHSNPKDYVVYKDYYKQAEKAYKKLHKKVDVVFGLTHVNKKNDKKLLKILPNLPLIMGGHEHVNMEIPVGNGKLTKADANAKTVYVHRISYNLKTKKVTIKSTLVPIDENIKEDTGVKKIVDKWDLFLDDKLNKILKNPGAILYNAKEALDGRDTPIRSIQTNLGILIAKSMSYGFENKVDCALINGGSIRIDDELQGAITGFDIFRVLPFGGGILKVKMTGKLLKQILDYGESKAGKGAYLQRFNASFNKNTKEWMINNQPIKLNKNYEVAITDYLLKGFDIPFLNSDNKNILSVYTPSKTEVTADIRKVVIHYLKALREN